MNLIGLLIIFLSASAFAHEWGEVRSIVEGGISQRVFPGGVLLIGNREGILYHQAFGKKGEGSTETTLETVYDLASLTKVVATSTSVMLLEERGLISLKDKLSAYFPDFSGSNKNAVTIEHLLRHQAGLAAGASLKEGESYAQFVTRILRSPLQYTPQSKTVYSDLGFIILGEIVKKVSGQSLSRVSQENIFDVLKMNSTQFSPALGGSADCAPTLPARSCSPHDPTAFRYWKTDETGHAGLFSTASDLSLLVSAYLNQGGLLFKKETVDKMTLLPRGQQRGLGWDFLSVYSTAPRGEIYPEGISYGHTGYTGTTIWIDPQSGSYLIFLANRVFLGDSETSKKFTAFRKSLSTAVGKQFYPKN